MSLNISIAQRWPYQSVLNCKNTAMMCKSKLWRKHLPVKFLFKKCHVACNSQWSFHSQSAKYRIYSNTRKPYLGQQNNLLKKLLNRKNTESVVLSGKIRTSPRWGPRYLAIKLKLLRPRGVHNEIKSSCKSTTHFLHKMSHKD